MLLLLSAISGSISNWSQILDIIITILYIINMEQQHIQLNKNIDTDLQQFCIEVLHDNAKLQLRCKALEKQNRMLRRNSNGNKTLQAFQ